MSLNGREMVHDKKKDLKNLDKSMSCLYPKENAAEVVEKKEQLNIKI